MALYRCNGSYMINLKFLSYIFVFTLFILSRDIFANSVCLEKNYSSVSKVNDLLKSFYCNKNFEEDVTKGRVPQELTIINLFSSCSCIVGFNNKIGYSVDEERVNEVKNNGYKSYESYQKRKINKYLNMINSGKKLGFLNADKMCNLSEIGKLFENSCKHDKSNCNGILGYKVTGISNHCIDKAKEVAKFREKFNQLQKKSDDSADNKVEKITSMKSRHAPFAMILGAIVKNQEYLKGIISKNRKTTGKIKFVDYFNVAIGPTIGKIANYLADGKKISEQKFEITQDDIDKYSLSNDVKPSEDGNKTQMFSESVKKLLSSKKLEETVGKLGGPDGIEDMLKSQFAIYESFFVRAGEFNLLLSDIKNKMNEGKVDYHDLNKFWEVAKKSISSEYSSNVETNICNDLKYKVENYCRVNDGDDFIEKSSFDVGNFDPFYPYKMKLLDKEKDGTDLNNERNELIDIAAIQCEVFRRKVSSQFKKCRSLLEYYERNRCVEVRSVSFCNECSDVRELIRTSYQNICDMKKGITSWESRRASIETAECEDRKLWDDLVSKVDNVYRGKSIADIDVSNKDLKTTFNGSISRGVEEGSGVLVDIMSKGAGVVGSFFEHDNKERSDNNNNPDFRFLMGQVERDSYGSGNSNVKLAKKVAERPSVSQVVTTATPSIVHVPVTNKIPTVNYQSSHRKKNSGSRRISSKSGKFRKGSPVHDRRLANVKQRLRELDERESKISSNEIDELRKEVNDLKNRKESIIFNNSYKRPSQQVNDNQNNDNKLTSIKEKADYDNVDRKGIRSIASQARATNKKSSPGYSSPVGNNDNLSSSSAQSYNNSSSKGTSSGAASSGQSVGARKRVTKGNTSGVASHGTGSASRVGAKAKESSGISGEAGMKSSEVNNDDESKLDDKDDSAIGLDLISSIEFESQKFKDDGPQKLLVKRNGFIEVWVSDLKSKFKAGENRYTLLKKVSLDKNVNLIKLELKDEL